MKKLVQTTLDPEQYRQLKTVANANASSAADTMRLAIKIGIEQLKSEIDARHRRAISHQPAA
jgi:hypothetical protein